VIAEHRRRGQILPAVRISRILDRVPHISALPRTTERPEGESGDECSELPRREAPQSHGRKSVVRGLLDNSGSATVAKLGFFRRKLQKSVLNGHDTIRSRFAKALQIKLLDERRQRQLPWLLTMVCLAAKLAGIHSQLAGHLDVRVREVKLLPCFVPPLKILWDSQLGLGHSATGCKVSLTNPGRNPNH